MVSLIAGRDGLDLLHDGYAISDLTEHTVTTVWATMVKATVIDRVNEELGGGGVQVVGTSHGDGAELVLKAVARLISDRCLRVLLLHVRSHASALDHEVRDHTVEDGAIIELIFHIAEEVLNSEGGLLGIKLDNDVAEAGLDFYGWVHR